MTDQNQKLTVIQHPRKKALEIMADRLMIDPVKLHQTLKNTVFKGCTDEEFMTLVVVANTYKLNPLLRQIFAFPSKKGGIEPVVSVDGWVSIIHGQPSMDGLEFEWQSEKDGSPISCTCSIFKKGTSRAFKVTEYFDECARDTDPWRRMPKRMLRHKALIQCSRYAFGLSGIIDEDEALERSGLVKTDRSAAPEFLLPPPPPVEEPKAYLDGQDFVAARAERAKRLAEEHVAAKRAAQEALSVKPSDYLPVEPPQETLPPEEVGQAEPTEQSPPAPSENAQQQTISPEEGQQNVIQDLAKKCRLAGVLEEQLVAWMKGKRMMGEPFTSLSEAPLTSLLRVVSSWKRIVSEVKATVVS